MGKNITNILLLFAFLMPSLASAAASSDTLRTDTVANDSSYAWSQGLENVTVKATRIRMVSKGDTLIFDAAAFKAAEGSMLKEIIKQLPGTELKANGDITVNGRKIDFLTLNGKDFFKGKNNIMLDNLPSYTVKKINVYHKSTEESRYLGRDVGDKDYVMDVELKKEYAMGSTISGEAGGGSSKRYEGRGFGLGYTDLMRLSVFGTVNNVNDNSSPGSDGNWQTYTSPQSLTTSKNLGFGMNLQDKEGTVKDNLDGQMTWTGDEADSWNQTERFMPSGNTFSMSSSSASSNSFSANVSNILEMTKPLYMNLTTALYYNRSRTNATSRSAELTGSPAQYGSTPDALDSVFAAKIPAYGGSIADITTNRTGTVSAGKASNLYATANLYATKKLSEDCALNLSTMATLQRADTYGHDIYRLEYPKGNGSDDKRRRYTTSPTRSYSYTAHLSGYVTAVKDWTFTADAGYDQSREASENNLYRLDRLNGWGADGHHGIWQTPQTADSLMLALDAANSHTRSMIKRTYGGKVSAVYMKTDKNGYTRFSVSMPISRASEEMRYAKSGKDTTLNRAYNVMIPSAMLYKSTEKGGYSFSYNANVMPPSLTYMVDTEDSSNPLMVREGNPRLKNALNHFIAAGYDLRNDARQGLLSLSATATIMSHSVSNGYTYDRATGIRTYRPENVEGNWSASAYASYGCAIDSARIWTWQTSTNLTYNRNVDLVSDNNLNGSILSKVDNLLTTEDIYIRYQNGETSVQATGQMSWRNSSSGRKGFRTINSFDFNYGITAQIPLPWKLRLSTDITMYSRRGYDDRAMNTDDLIWNAQLSRSFLKGRLTVKIKGYDLIRQMKSVSYYVDGQGKTETWNNSLTRYVMVGIGFRLDGKRP